MQKGLLPIKRKDHRTFDFARTFGSVSPDVIPKEFNFDVSGCFPDQNLEDMPQACTAYTENDIASNDDISTNFDSSQKYGYYDDQLFTYNNTKDLLGLRGQVPVDLMTALKAGTIYGVKKKSETPEQALTHRRSPYFIIKKNPDYFDGLVSALWQKRGGLSIGTPWLLEMHLVEKDGTVPDFTAPKNFTSGHCWEACGVKVIDNLPHIICKSWQGPNFGDKGYCYFNRKQINDLLSVSGSGAFGQKHASPEDIKAVKMTLIETLISKLQILLERLLTAHVDSVPDLPPALPVQAPQPQPEPVIAPHLSKLTAWAHAIEAFEDAPKAWCNPGAIRGKNKQFLRFPTYQAGFDYLCDYLTRAATGKHPSYNPEFTLLKFTETYAPSSDRNHPDLYAAFVAKRLGVTVAEKIKNLI